MAEKKTKRNNIKFEVRFHKSKEPMTAERREAILKGAAVVSRLVIEVYKEKS